MPYPTMSTFFAFMTYLRFTLFSRGHNAKVSGRPGAAWENHTRWNRGAGDDTEISICPADPLDVFVIFHRCFVMNTNLYGSAAFPFLSLKFLNFVVFIHMTYRFPGFSLTGSTQVVSLSG